MQRLFASLLVFFLIGCSDPLEKSLDQRFPPIDLKTQRQAAIDSLARSLNGLELPAVSIGIEIQELERILRASDDLDPSIHSLQIRGGQQILDLRLDVAKSFAPKDWALDPKIEEILGERTIDLEATITFGLGFTLDPETSSQHRRALVLKALPSVAGVEIRKVDLVKSDGKHRELALLASAIEILINRYSENLSGQISKLDFFTTRIPVSMVDTNDPSGIIHTGNDSGLTVTLKSNEVMFPFEIGEVALLVDQDHLRAMVSLATAGSGSAPGSGHDPQSYREARKLFDEIHDTVFGLEAPEHKLWVGLTRNLISQSLNSVFNQSKACLIAQSDIPQSTFREKVRLPSGESIDCTSGRDCSPTRNCSFKKKKDTRNCSACLLRAPRICAFGGCTGGQCIQRGNDPACELAKLGQNKIYEAEYAGKKLDCERLKTQERLTCEAEKATEKALCEAGKDVVDLISRTGNAANIKGHIQGKARVNVCLDNLSISKDLSRIKAHLDLEGSAKLDGRLEAVPLDIVGHLICQMPTASDLDFEVEIPRHSQAVDLRVALGVVDGQLGASFTTDSLEAPLRLTPSPTEWLMANTDMTFKCQGLNLIKPLIVAGNSFLPELRGTMTLKQPPTDGWIEIEVPEQEVSGQTMTLEPDVSDQSLFLFSNH